MTTSVSPAEIINKGPQLRRSIMRHNESIKVNSQEFQLIYAFEYNQLVKKLMHRFKFQQAFRVGKALTKTLIQQLVETSISQGLPDAIIAFPHHEKRFMERGFSSSLEITQTISRYFKIPIIYPLIRVKNPGQQAQLSKTQRKKNLHKSIALTNKETLASMNKTIDFKTAHLALVDDIYTTGASVQSAIECLKDLGAFRIDVWVIAKTPLFM